MTELEACKEILEAAGYVVIKAGSYRRAQERQRTADLLRRYAEEAAGRSEAWGRECCEEERRIRDRLTYVYGVARAKGATDDELRGDGWVKP